LPFLGAGGNLKVCLVSKCTVSEFWESHLSTAKDVDLVVFSPLSLGVVSYEKELDGETEYFQDLAKLSKVLGAVIICGCETDTYGAIRKSAVIADRGKLLGVSDTVYMPVGSEYECGSNFVVYKTSVGKIGVIIGTDLYSFEAVKGMALGDADLIVSIFEKIDNFNSITVALAESYLCGVPIAQVFEGFSVITSITGEVDFKTNLPVANFNINTEKVYDNLQFKKRGFFGKG